MNAVEIEEAVSALAAQAFDREEFPFAFLEAYGNKSTTIKRLRKGNSNKSKVAGGVLQRNNIHIATCEEGTVEDALQQLREAPETAKQKATFILATDGKDFQAENVNSGETLACAYPDFHEHFSFFFELAGISSVKEIRESTFDIKATGRLNKLYVELLRANPDWAAPERRQDMNHFMARLIFCFFAEDTQIFHTDNLFTDTVQQMSAPDGSNAHEVIAELFRAMDTPHKQREAQGIRTWASKFPYVNGQLFSGSTDCPRFTKIARSYLLHVGHLNWKQINPDIFGSMIQAVADEDERGSLGMHYTSVPNILKVLNPLFLDDLRAQLQEAGDNARKLLNLRKRLARIRVFDPACGSGNFLVIAYKQLREIEHEVNRLRGEPHRTTDIPLTNFRGIEIKGFSAEIARLALIIAEYQCDVLYRGQQVALDEFLPLDAENWIISGNALRLDWLSVCPPTGTGVKVQRQDADLFSPAETEAEIAFENEGGETYICGNPPYYGSRKQAQEQKADLKALCAKEIKKWKSLDYVAGWMILARRFMQHVKAEVAFVTTSSMCEGIQVPVLWPHILIEGTEIKFAHTPFSWANLAAHNAGVTVVVVGITNKKYSSKQLFLDDSQVQAVGNITPYLTPGETVFIETKSKPISEVPRMVMGSMPRDGGNLIMSSQEASNFKQTYPEAKHLIRRYLGSEDLIKGLQRSCVWVQDSDVDLATSINELKVRFDRVEKMRLESTLKSTNDFAKQPYRFVYLAGTSNYQIIAVGRVSSIRRPYLPVDVLEPSCVPSDALCAIYDAPIWTVSLIASKLHIAWIASVCGKLKTDYRYSNTLGWNTFPVPKLTSKNKEDLTRCAEEILLARERHFPATIADLYDPDKMPEDLRRAHERNDEVLERIYIGRRFKNDTERLEKLFALYTEMTNQAKKDPT